MELMSSAFLSRDWTHTFLFCRQREAAARLRSRNLRLFSSGFSLVVLRRRPPVLGGVDAVCSWSRTEGPGGGWRRGGGRSRRGGGSSVGDGAALDLASRSRRYLRKLLGRFPGREFNMWGNSHEMSMQRHEIRSVDSDCTRTNRRDASWTGAGCAAAKSRAFATETHSCTLKAIISHAAAAPTALPIMVKRTCEFDEESDLLTVLQKAECFATLSMHV
ncbi:hypothetical protein EYF80_029417 [Liparis tanakae]|uniref:Uncharacterized protein n=1 Tax=Liparis tanakae TaxID=230148 RepID=A0A4Z2H3F3_9TELE|nr:hypothetical protein EYF80_029417 [Liparis tanakae]